MILMFSIIFIMGVNGLLFGTFDKLTMYKGHDLSTQTFLFIISYLFFGLLMFPFYKPIKTYRKKYYFEKILLIYEEQLSHFNFNDSILIKERKNRFYVEYENHKRYLKLMKLTKKCKRKKLWSNLHIL